MGHNLVSNLDSNALKSKNRCFLNQSQTFLSPCQSTRRHTSQFMKSGAKSFLILVQKALNFQAMSQDLERRRRSDRETEQRSIFKAKRFEIGNNKSLTCCCTSNHS